MTKLSKSIITNDAPGNADQNMQPSAFYQAYFYSLELCRDPETALQVAMMYLQNCGIRDEVCRDWNEAPQISSRKYSFGLNQLPGGVR